MTSSYLLRIRSSRISRLQFMPGTGWRVLLPGGWLGMKVVQAKCPGCQRALRIPENVLGGSMRCKHCGKVFQFRSSSSAGNPSTPKADATRRAGKTETPRPKPLPKGETEKAERVEATVRTE